MQKFKEQLPTLCVLAVIIIVAAIWSYNGISSSEGAALSALRDQNEALKTQMDDNRRQLDATNDALKAALARRPGGLFATDVETGQMENEQINRVAEAVARRVVSALPGPKTPEEIARMQDAQVDKVSERMAEKITPLIGQINQGQQQLATAQQTIDRDNRQIQQLNGNLQTTEAAAQDALKLSHEISAMYLDSFNNHGVLLRVLALPANLVQDTANLDFVTSHDRDKQQQELDAKMQAIEARLNQIQAPSQSAGNGG